MTQLANQLGRQPTSATPSRTLLTAALPYANGDLHVGHATEQVMTDMHARHLRQRGCVVVFVCGDDQHGSAIDLAASAGGRSAEAQIADVERRHLQDLRALGISADLYQGTHSDQNRRLTTEVYLAMKAQGLIDRRTEQQLYDPAAGMFLADRHVRGECPTCGAPNQCGDNCEVCGATYSALELRNPVSVHSGARPEVRSSEQLYFKLSSLGEQARRWLKESGAVDEATARKASEWVDGDLRDWCISRSAPYFGFEIPGEPGKYFYVWVDAPMGYLAATLAWCERHGYSFADIWRPRQSLGLHGPQWRVVHVIGKDIQKFHSVFFPAMLTVAGFKTPDKIVVHGFLTVNGKKMSKRDGTLLTLKALLDEVPPEAVRYYLASKLTPGQADMDLDFAEFERKVNGDLVGKLVNLAARTAPLLEQHFNNVLAQRSEQGDALIDRILEGKTQVMDRYDQFDTAGAIRSCMALADEVNRYIEGQAPWRLAKDPAQRELLHQVCSVAIQAFGYIMLYLAPVVPQLAERTWKFLGVDSEPRWEGADVELWGKPIRPYTRLLDRVSMASLESARIASIPAGSDDLPKAPVDWAPLIAPVPESRWREIDLRVARILEVQACTGRPEDVALKLDYGHTEAAIAEVQGLGRAPLKQAELLGRMVIARVNAQPEGEAAHRIQLCTVRGEGAEVFLSHPAEGARPGMRVT